MMPDLPPGTEDDDGESNSATPKEPFNPDDPSSYVPPSNVDEEELSKESAFHNDK